MKIKIDASKHKPQIRLSPKPLRFFKIVPTKGLLEFYLVYNSLHSKCLRLKKGKHMSILAQMGFFSIFDQLKIDFGQISFKILLTILKPLLCFESKTNLKFEKLGSQNNDF